MGSMVTAPGSTSVAGPASSSPASAGATNTLPADVAAEIERAKAK
jgi:hypothetical protein